MDLQFVARLVVAASAVALLVVGLGVLAWEATRSHGEPAQRDTGPLALVNFVGILGFVGAGLATAVTVVGVLEPLPEPLDAVDRLVGIAAVVAAGLLALWGLLSIGGEMSSQAEVRADTELVTTGAFGLVRHPLYLSILLLWAGASVALLSWFMAACTIVLVPPFVARSRLEERLLVDHFGDAYRRYADRVPLLLPLFRGH
jgi:protein-S-isoprenylcysteine O-methyltransferase Ste14